VLNEIHMNDSLLDGPSLFPLSPSPRTSSSSSLTRTPMVLSTLMLVSVPELQDVATRLQAHFIDLFCNHHNVLGRGELCCRWLKSSEDLLLSFTPKSQCKAQTLNASEPSSPTEDSCTSSVMPA
jgi:hypothetical protein